jgi:hypothetical protein
MKRFIAYFDYLGFKEFIEHNDILFQKRIMNNNFRDMEDALGKGNYIELKHGLITDISKSTISCINFSDTVVFFSADTSESSLLEILEVAYKFNHRSICYCFPVRGAIVFGELVQVEYQQKTSNGGSYNINSVYGRGLVSAHQRANSQDWAGTLVDQSLIDELIHMGLSSEDTLNPFTKKFSVPYKNGESRPQEYVLGLSKGTLNEVSLANVSETIRNNFADYNKPVDDPLVQKKIENTLNFLKSYFVE